MKDSNHLLCPVKCTLIAVVRERSYEYGIVPGAQIHGGGCMVLSALTSRLVRSRLAANAIEQGIATGWRWLLLCGDSLLHDYPFLDGCEYTFLGERILWHSIAVGATLYDQLLGKKRIKNLMDCRHIGLTEIRQLVRCQWNTIDEIEE